MQEQSHLCRYPRVQAHYDNTGPHTEAVTSRHLIHHMVLSVKVATLCPMSLRARVDPSQKQYLTHGTRSHNLKPKRLTDHQEDNSLELSKDHNIQKEGKTCSDIECVFFFCLLCDLM